MQGRKMSIKFQLMMVAFLATTLVTACEAWEYPEPELEAIVESSTPALRVRSEALASTGASFLGQVIEVTGTVEHVANKGGQPGVTLSGGVMCGFGRKQKQMVSTLQKGDGINLRGVYERGPRGSMGPLMTACIRVQ
jgi:hypothetical protein